MDYIFDRLIMLSDFDQIMFCINLVVFLFSKQIVALYPRSDQEEYLRSRLGALHMINFSLFFLYVISVFLAGVPRELPQTGLTLLAAYLRDPSGSGVYLTAFRSYQRI